MSGWNRSSRSNLGKHRSGHSLNNHRKSSSSSHGDNFNSECEKLLNHRVIQRALEADGVTLNADLDHMPAFECFAIEIDAEDAKRKLIDDLRVGNELFARVRRVELAGLFLQPLCIAKPFRRSLKWIPDFQILVTRNLLDIRDYRPNDIVKVLVAEIDEINTPIFSLDVKAGILSDADLPAYFRNEEGLGSKTFNQYIKEFPSLNNPNLAHCFRMEINYAASLLMELHEKDFSSRTRAPYIRMKQDELISMESVKRGVDKIRENEHSIAIQHFNKALEIFQNNVEALVARAAAYANLGLYDTAEKDLEQALSVNEKHNNARAYMVETLLQGAKKLESEGKIDEAKAKYEKIVQLFGDKRAEGALNRLNNLHDTNDPVDVESEDESEMHRKKRETMKEEKKRKEIRKQNARKLAEYERFIEKLKANN